MKASILDLRYKSTKILEALERNEEVTVLYHGKVKGVIKPVRKEPRQKVVEHPMFGMLKDDASAVDEIMMNLRKPRHAL
jgi:antitoxin (DNA-binding transcriptional repressor) of toxin-antitoxin stability system